MKALIAVVTAVLALSGCGSSLTGPDERDEAAETARARQNLEAATPQSGPSLKLSAN